jgi:hypothetical protein
MLQNLVNFSISQSSSIKNQNIRILSRSHNKVQQSMCIPTLKKYLIKNNIYT